MVVSVSLGLIRRHVYAGLSFGSSNSGQVLRSCLKRNFGQPTALTHPGLISCHEVTPCILKTEYQNRRNGLANLIRCSAAGELMDTHAVVLTSHDRSYMTHGIPFIYRQHSNLSYLSGFLEPDSALVIDIDKSGHQSTLFVKNQTPQEDLWEGYRSGLEKSKTLTGVDNTDDIKSLPLHLSSLKANSESMIWYNTTTPASPTLHSQIVQALPENRNRVRSPDSLIQKLRLHKSEAELDLMRTAGHITAEMFIESMVYSLENPHEHNLFAKFDFECRTRGANNLAYLPVVAGGENALTIHYIRNDAAIPQNSMVLVDAGADFYGYVADCTRTWPVSGRFSSAQRDLYEAVHEVFQTCLTLCQADKYSLNDIHSAMTVLIARQLIRLNVADSSMSDGELAKLAQQICPHHVGHYLGLDVHDTPLMTRDLILQPNMAICIEPGMYFGHGDSRIKKEFRGIGVRIEDDIVITQNGYENLTDTCPTSADGIESLLNSG